MRKNDLHACRLVSAMAAKTALPIQSDEFFKSTTLGTPPAQADRELSSILIKASSFQNLP
ncbi:MAG: hypothetical protein EAZ42_00590 [Verrucomicrobia bacterium]|nr:MAG: hypothetical protein EAZ42_00590 [Verrucomicrobiota bacterium]